MILTTGENTRIAKVSVVQDGDEVNILINAEIVAYFQSRNGKIQLQLCNGFDETDPVAHDDEGYLLAIR